MLRQVAVGLLLGAAIVSPVHGQDPTPASAASLSDSVERARSVGSAAADEREVAGYFGLAFLGGLPAGLFFPVSFIFGDSPTLGAGMAGATLMAVTIHLAMHGRTDPPPSALEPFAASPRTQQAFRDAYAARLTRRRVRASLWGGAIGASIGLGTLVILAHQVGDF